MTKMTPKEKRYENMREKISKGIEYHQMSSGKLGERTQEWAKYRPGGIIRTSNYKK